MRGEGYVTRIPGQRRGGHVPNSPVECRVIDAFANHGIEMQPGYIHAANQSEGRQVLVLRPDGGFGLRRRFGFLQG